MHHDGANGAEVIEHGLPGRLRIPCREGFDDGQVHAPLLRRILPLAGPPEGEVVLPLPAGAATE